MNESIINYSFMSVGKHCLLMIGIRTCNKIPSKTTMTISAIQKIFQAFATNAWRPDEEEEVKQVEDEE